MEPKTDKITEKDTKPTLEDYEKKLTDMENPPEQDNSKSIELLEKYSNKLDELTKANADLMAQIEMLKATNQTLALHTSVAGGQTPKTLEEKLIENFA